MPKPTPLSPKMGAALDAAAPAFSWKPAEGADGYRLQIASAPGFAEPLLDVETGPVTEITLADALTPTEDSRFWRVGAMAGGDVEWSRPVPFRLPAPAELAVARDAEAAEARTRAASDREARKRQRGRTVVPPPPVAPALAPLPTGDTLSGAPSTTDWRRVPGVMEHPPEATASTERPTPAAPLAGAIVDGASATFLWRPVPDATGYEIEVAPTAAFSGPTLRLDAGTTAEITLSGLLPTVGDRLFWRVRAHGAEGAGPWSKYGRFYAGTLDQAEAFHRRQDAERDYARRVREHEALSREADLDLVAPFDRPDATTSDASVYLVMSMMALGILMMLGAAIGGMVTPG